MSAASVRARSVLSLLILIFGLSRVSALDPATESPGEGQQSSSSAPIVLRAALSHAAYDKSNPEELLLKVDFVSADSIDNDRPPLNIALVLDRSSSMKKDHKIAYALDAARAVIQNLSKRDIVSLIIFNERPLVLAPAGAVVNKPFLYHRLDEVSPEGTTDLSAGLLEGIAQIESQSAEGQVRYVLLLTDGKANRGVTRSSPLRKIAKKALARGIRISTLGVGSEFNEKTLTLLAESGGGRYRYVQSPEQLPDAFKEELHGLLKIAAQNVRLEIVVTQGGTIRKLYGQLWDDPRKSFKTDIGNLRAGERGSLLLALEPSGFKPDATLQATIHLTFDNPETAERSRQVVESRAVFSSDWRKENVPQNNEVVLYANVLKSLETATEALEGFDIDRYRKARIGFETAYHEARQLALTQRNQDLLNQTFILKHFMEELEATHEEGRLHGHAEMEEKLRKASDYQRYLLFHHRNQPGQDHDPK